MNKIIDWSKETKIKVHPVILFIIQFFVLESMTLFIASIILSQFGENRNTQITMISTQVAMFISCLIWLFIIEKRSIAIFNKKGSFKEYLKGMLLGMCAVSFVSLPVLIFFQPTSYLSTLDLSSSHILKIFLWLLFFMIQGAAEELLVRAVMMPTLARKVGVYGSVVLTSLLFSLLHFSNPSVSFIALLNTFIIGCTFGIMVFYYQSFWHVFAAHTMWNFMLGCIYGIQVSGINALPSLFQSNIVGSQILTGGEYGIEGSILTTVFGSVILCRYIYLYRCKRRECN